jgi:hypothetical protein
MHLSQLRSQGHMHEILILVNSVEAGRPANAGLQAMEYWREAPFGRDAPSRP